MNLHVISWYPCGNVRSRVGPEISASGDVRYCVGPEISASGDIRSCVGPEISASGDVRSRVGPEISASSSPAISLLPLPLGMATPSIILARMTFTLKNRLSAACEMLPAPTSYWPSAGEEWIGAGLVSARCG